MPAYWIARSTVSDADAYAKYAPRARDAIKAHGGKFLVRGGALKVLEGSDRPRAVLVEFPSLAAAEACYNSAEYQEALTYAKGAAERDVCIVEGI
jgi:uncharacterized protein (DUF1330 family)